MDAFNYLSLFSGIGGLDLGLDRAGMTCVGQVERDQFCRRVLTKHWPEVPKHDDVRTAVDWWLGARRPAVQLVAGGFPCQPFSVRGARLGTADERWGWPWMSAVIRGLLPRVVLVENVAALVTDRRFADAFGWVLADLASLGYDAEWDCVPANSVGAPHERDRVFLVAYARGQRRGQGPGQLSGVGAAQCGPPVSDAHGERCGRRPGTGCVDAGWPEPAHRSWWRTEPDVGRVAHGIPARVDRIRGLGNAVVPAVAEHIGRLILAAGACATSNEVVRVAESDLRPVTT